MSGRSTLIAAGLALLCSSACAKPEPVRLGAPVLS